MASIFNQEPIKTIPKSLAACNECPDVAYELWHRARFFEKSGIVLFVIYIIVGIAISCGCGGDDYCLSVVGGVVLGFISYAFCKAIALLIGALAALVYNASISASIAIYQSSGNPAEETTKESVSASTPTPDPAPDPAPAPDPTPEEMNAKYWTCKKCRAVNKKVSGICWNCGNYR